MADKKDNLDPVLGDTLSKTEKYIEQNKKSLSIILGAVVLAIAGYLIYQKVYVAGKEKDAEQQMWASEVYFKNDSLKKVINGDGQHPGMEEIADQYSVSKSGNLAKYYLGMAYLKNKEYDKAIDALKSYDAKDIMTGALAYMGIGDAYTEQNNLDEASDYYEKAIKENPNDFTTPLAMMKLAGTCEAQNKFKEALDIYKNLKRDYPMTTQGRDVDKYIARAEEMVK